MLSRLLRPVVLPALALAVAPALLAQTTQTAVARIAISPATRQVSAGDTIRFTAQALDAQGNHVSGVRVRFNMVRGEGGEIDSAGVLITGSTGVIAASASAIMPGQRPRIERFDVRILPGPAAHIEVAPQPTRLVAGQRLLIAAKSWSAQNDERKNDEYRYTSSAPAVVRASSDGFLSTHARARDRYSRGRKGDEDADDSSGA